MHRFQARRQAKLSVCAAARRRTWLRRRSTRNGGIRLLAGPPHLRRGLQSARISDMAELVLMDAAALDTEATPGDGFATHGDGTVSIVLLGGLETAGGDVEEATDVSAVDVPGCTTSSPSVYAP